MAEKQTSDDDRLRQCFDHTQTEALTWSQRADGDAQGVSPQREHRLICLPLWLRCFDQPNEIYGELGLSFCRFTQNTGAVQKIHCGHARSDGWMRLLMFQTTEHHSKPFFLFTCKHTRELRILLIVPYAPTKETKTWFYEKVKGGHFIIVFHLEHSAESQSGVLNSHLSGMK